MYQLSLLCLLLFTNVSFSSPVPQSAPQVDFGYTIHQGEQATTSKGLTYYNYTSVRYAAAPLGEHRFAHPAPPAHDRTVQKNPNFQAICPQGAPGWSSTPIVIDNDTQPIFPATRTSDNVEGEDCLFLDIIVPKAVFEQRGNGGKKAKVILWIHGGGYIMGWKNEYGDGQGLFERAAENGEEGVIYVAINYRLGIFGFLGGATVQSHGPVNLGLRDQRYAMEWIRKYAHLFGGDGEDITLIGESAGGGSIMSQIAAFGGRRRSLFNRAIPQSPFIEYISPAQQEATYQNALSVSGAKTYAQLKNLSSSALVNANQALINNAFPFGTFVFGPVVDGEFLPDIPSVLFAEGRIDKQVSVMTGHNTDESVIFVPPSATTPSQYDAFIASLFPDASNTTLNYISSALYPLDFGGSFGYTTPQGRLSTTVADYSIVCNARYMDDTISKSQVAYAYVFGVPPGNHAQDLSYTFYDDVEQGSTNDTLAITMQKYFTNFAQTGNPNGDGLPGFEQVDGTIVQGFNDMDVGPIMDETMEERRCNFWQKGSYR